MEKKRFKNNEAILQRELVEFKVGRLNAISKNVFLYEVFEFFNLADLMNLLNTNKQIRQLLEKKCYKIYIFNYLRSHFNTIEQVISAVNQEIENLKILLKNMTDIAKRKYNNYISQDNVNIVFLQYVKMLANKSSLKLFTIGSKPLCELNIQIYALIIAESRFLKTVIIQGDIGIAEALEMNYSISTKLDMKEAKSLSQVKETIHELSFYDVYMEVNWVQSLSKSLESCKIITIIGISDCNFNGEKVKYLSEFLKVNSSLKYLYLIFNQIADWELKDLSDALKINSSLTELDLSSNNIGANGAKYLSGALKINNTLQVLNLNQNELRDEGVMFLSEALISNSSLCKIDLAANHIFNNGLYHICEALKNNTRLTYICLNFNVLTEIGAEYISEVLSMNSTITHMILSENHFYDTRRVNYISKALLKNTSLLKLDLSSCDIEDFGCGLISEALKINTTLIDINLSYNNIRNMGAKFISEALKENTSIKFISLLHNRINDDGAICLLESLKINYGIAQMDVSGNEIKDEILKSFSDILEQNLSLSFK